MVKRNVVRLDTLPIMFTVIGISSHENDYRLSWSINEQMKLAFAHGGKIVTDAQKEFSCFIHEDEDQKISLVSNRCDNGFLFDKYRNMDFLLKFDTVLDETALRTWLSNLRKVPLVSAVFHLPVTKQIVQILG